MSDVDDDRLLDLALGLEDDPEVTEAVARSAELQQRLSELEADLRAIDRELHNMLPASAEDWNDPTADRWQRLHPYFAEPRPRSWPIGRRGRLLAPAIAVMLLTALVIGVLVSGGSRTTSEPPSGSSALTKTSSSLAAPGSAAETASAQKLLTAVEHGYQTIVVARAGKVTGSRQSFTVVRTLKGSAPATFHVQLVAGAGAAVGSLLLAYLNPPATGSPATSESAAHAGSITPSPATSTATAGTNAAGSAFEPLAQEGQILTATYAGKPAVLEPLPAGVDPAALKLP
jgi:hypothetical protein